MNESTHHAEPVREDLRYITGRCPICSVMSPVCDQQEDIRRETISNWWFPHFDSQHRFGPIFERAKPPEHSDGFAVDAAGAEAAGRADAPGQPAALIDGGES